MTYEFIIRDVKTKEDLFFRKKVPDNRYNAVKEAYETQLKREKEKDHLADLVLLINRCDDEGNFEEVVQ